MTKFLHIWRIPEPPADEVAEYLEMGWIRVKEFGEPWLMWSFARGTPEFPGGEAERKRREAERGGPAPPPHLH